MHISAISNINFKQNPQTENGTPKEDKKSLSTTSKALIGAGVVAAGTLAVYFITRNRKAAKAAAENLPKPKTNEAPNVKTEPAKPLTNETPKTEIEPAKQVNEETKVKVDNADEKPLNVNDSTPKNTPDTKNYVNKGEFSYGPNAFKFDSPTAKEAYNKLDDKIKTVLDKFISEFEDLTHRSIETLKNGITKITYYGALEDGGKAKEVLVFNKNNDILFQQTESFVLEKVMNKFPVEYIKTTKYTFPDKKVKSSVKTYYLDMVPKRLISNDNGKTKTIIYGYDMNSRPSGIAYRENDKVILKLHNKKFGQVYDSFEDLFKNVERDEFKMR